MSIEKELKSIERKTYLSFHEDGLIDLLAGFSFCLYGIVLLWINPGLIGLCFMPTLLIVPLKKWLVTPRMGIVRFAQTRKNKIKRTGIIGLVLGILCFLFVTLFLNKWSFNDLLDRYYLILFGLLIALPPFIGAVILGVRRYYLYALLILVTFSIGNFIRDSFPVIFLVLGGIFSLSGTGLLIRFLLKYPKQNAED